jgi:hypothetical protein
MTSPVTLERDNPKAPPPIAVRRIAKLMSGVAVTLGIASALHLAGLVHGRSAPFDPTHAGIAEAIIGATLAGGAVTVVRTPDHARAAALGTVAFATVGFGVGLTFTVRGGHLPDVLYHVAVLPLLIGSLIVLIRTPDPASSGRQVRDEDDSVTRS